MRTLLRSLTILVTLCAAYGQSKFEFWPGTTYDPAIPTIEKVLGYKPGERISSHSNLMRYLEMSGLTPRHGWSCGTDVGMEGDRLLVQAHHRFLRIVGPFIYLQNVLHAGNVVFIQFGHAPHFFPATA
ncbi:MAG: hypothetical protein IPJ98_00065 [Bryobacterales bacterium]|nr:hypothetical protein [Bryobacterales bacterium]